MNAIETGTVITVRSCKETDSSEYNGIFAGLVMEDGVVQLKLLQRNNTNFSRLLKVAYITDVSVLDSETVEAEDLEIGDVVIIDDDRELLVQEITPIAVVGAKPGEENQLLLKFGHSQEATVAPTARFTRKVLA